MMASTRVSFKPAVRAWVATLVLVLASLGAEAASSAAPPKHLLVVAPRAFHEALGPFVRYKQTLLPTDLVALETVLATSPGADDPEKVKRYLYDAWRGHQAEYVLLVGDVDVMPVRFMVLDRVTPAAFDYAFYPSDLYYSDLAKADGSFEDWNGRRDGFHAGYYGEVRGEKHKADPINFDQVDYRPEVAVGRWPVSTPAEVGVVAAKTIRYERWVRAGIEPGGRRALLVNVGGWVDTRHLMDQWAEGLAHRWEIEKRYYTDPGQPPRTPPPTEDEVIRLLNRGLGLVVHSGHGDADLWVDCLRTADLSRLQNAAHPPVMVSAGCSTAYFAPLPPYQAYVDVRGGEHRGTDQGEVFTAPPPPPAPYQRGRFNPTGLGEQLLRGGPNGAVAYIGCDTGSQPCALSLVEGFLRALSAADEPRLGDCWAQAVAYYFDHEHLASLRPNSDWYPPSVFFQGMKFMVFGDPSLRLPGKRGLNGGA